MIKNYLKFNWWKEAAYLARYAGSGVINTIVNFIIIFSAMAFGFSLMVLNVVGYIVGFILGFVLSKIFIFRSNGHFVVESIRCFIFVQFVGVAFNIKFEFSRSGFSNCCSV